MPPEVVVAAVYSGLALATWLTPRFWLAGPLIFGLGVVSTAAASVGSAPLGATVVPAGFAAACLAFSLRVPPRSKCRMEFAIGDLMEYSVWIAIACLAYRVVDAILASYAVVLVAYVAALYYFLRWAPVDAAADE